jgi:hypothetical protein
MSFFGSLIDAVNQSVDESIGIDDNADESVILFFNIKSFVFCVINRICRRISNH